MAVNTSLALSRMPGNNVLLADFDLNCGLVGFMLQAHNNYSIVDAALNSMDMDENLWPKIVTSIGNLDVLPVGKLNPGFRMEGAHIRHLVDFARRLYKVICVDLSGIFEKYTLELMHEAKQIYLVCTPEIPSLHLAREKLAFLHSLELDGRVSILLNRAHKRHTISLAEMEKLFGVPIYLTLPNDYLGVHEGLTSGKNVNPKSELGRKFNQLARSMMGEAISEPGAEKKHAVLDFLGFRKKRPSPERSRHGLALTQ